MAQLKKISEIEKNLLYGIQTFKNCASRENVKTFRRAGEQMSFGISVESNGNRHRSHAMKVREMAEFKKDNRK